MVLATILVNNDVLQKNNKFYMAWYAGSIESWGIRERNFYARCFTNAIMTPSSDEPLTGSGVGVSTARNTSCLAKFAVCCQNAKCT